MNTLCFKWNLICKYYVSCCWSVSLPFVPLWSVERLGIAAQLTGSPRAGVMKRANAALPGLASTAIFGRCCNHNCSAITIARSEARTEIHTVALGAGPAGHHAFSLLASPEFAFFLLSETFSLNFLQTRHVRDTLSHSEGSQPTSCSAFLVPRRTNQLAFERISRPPSSDISACRHISARQCHVGTVTNLSTIDHQSP